MTTPVSPEILELMDRAGTKVYIPADLPNDIEFGRTGECFDTCIMRAMRLPHYKYVEGIAKIKGQKQWALHAWLTDGIHAYDPTWGAVDNRTGKIHAAPAIYIGVWMDTRGVAKFMAATEYQGVLANHWRAPELADAAMIKMEVPA